MSFGIVPCDPIFDVHRRADYPIGILDEPGMAISPVYDIACIEGVIFPDAPVALLYPEFTTILSTISCMKMLLRTHNIIVMYCDVERNRQLLNQRTQNCLVPKYLMNMNTTDVEGSQRSDQNVIFIFFYFQYGVIRIFRNC